MGKGRFVFSFDFELYWGVHHSKSYKGYEGNLNAAIENLQPISKIFREYDARFTCGSVGMLYNLNWEQWYANQVKCLPNYFNKELNPYSKVQEIKQNVKEKHLFASEVLAELSKDGHEMATHTYSHFLTLEQGATAEAFEEDLRMSLKIAEKFGHEFKSIIFPRNQYSEEYLLVCKKYGIEVFRGNPVSGLFDKSKTRVGFVLKRIVRMFDSYISISGHNTFLTAKDSFGMLNVPSSLFYRSSSSVNLKILNRMHLMRIKRSMTHAAKSGEVFHLWCHPHNVTTNSDLDNIRSILDHFNYLREKYGFTSYRMMDFL